MRSTTTRGTSAAAVGPTTPARGWECADKAQGFQRPCRGLKILSRQRKSFLTVTAIAAGLLTALTTQSAQAGILYWDTNGASPGFYQVDGNWSNAYWSTDSTGSSATAAWVAGSDAYFKNSGPVSQQLTVRPGTAQSVRNVTVNGFYVSLNGALGGGFTLATDAAWGASFGATLQISSDVDNGGNVLTIDAAGRTFVHGGTISGSGSLAKSGTGSLEIDSAQTYTGGTNLNGGTIYMYHAGALGSSGTIHFGGGTLALAIPAAATCSPRFSNAPNQFYRFDTISQHQNKTIASDLTSVGGSLWVQGEDTLILTGANTYTGGTTVFVTAGATRGVLQIGDGGTTGTLGTGVISLVGTGAHLSFNRSDSVAVANTIGGQGWISKDGGGTLTLSGANTYSGFTEVNSGVLVVGHNNALGGTTSGTDVYSGAALQITGGRSIGNETLNLYGSGVGNTGALRSMNGTNSWAGQINLMSAARINSEASSTLFLAGAVSGVNKDLTLGGDGDIAVSSSLSLGLGKLTKAGTGRLTLNNNNTYTGGTDLNGGRIWLGHAGAAGASGTITFGGGILEFTANNTTDYSARFSTAPNQAYSVDTWAQNVTFASPLISSGGSLEKRGSGTLALAEANSYNGPTTVWGGSLLLKHQNALHNSTVNVFAGGGVVFDSSVSGHAFTFGGLSGLAANPIALADNGGSPVALSVGNNNQYAQYDGSLSGTGSLTKIGNGVLGLTGSNTYTGATNVTAGTLALRRTDALSNSTAVAISGTGTLDIGPYDQHVGTFSISSGSLNGSATLYANTYNVTGGTINAHLGTTGSTANFTGGSNTVNSASAAGSVNVTGSGTTLTLGTGASFTNSTASFSVDAGASLDATAISSGLTLSGGQRLTNNGVVTGSVTAQSGGTVKGAGEFNGPVTIGAGGNLAPGNSPGGTSFGSGLSFLAGGTYVWEVNKVTGLGGDQSSLKGIDPGFDFADVTGTLAINGPFTIDITGLDLSNNTGHIDQWNPAHSYSWIIASASGGITGANNLTLFTSHFTDNNLTNGGVNSGFSLDVVGNNLMLNYTPLPEPSTLVLLTAGGLLGMWGHVRRRRKRGTAA